MMQLNDAILLVFDNTKVMKPPKESIHKDFHNARKCEGYESSTHKSFTNFTNNNSFHQCLTQFASKNTPLLFGTSLKDKTAYN